MLMHCNYISFVTYVAWHSVNMLISRPISFHFGISCKYFSPLCISSSHSLLDGKCLIALTFLSLFLVVALITIIGNLSRFYQFKLWK